MNVGLRKQSSSSFIDDSKVTVPDVVSVWQTAFHNYYTRHEDPRTSDQMVSTLHTAARNPHTSGVMLLAPFAGRTGTFQRESVCVSCHATSNHAWRRGGVPHLRNMLSSSVAGLSVCNREEAPASWCNAVTSLSRKSHVSWSLGDLRRGRTAVASTLHAAAPCDPSPLLLALAPPLPFHPLPAVRSHPARPNLSPTYAGYPTPPVSPHASALAIPVRYLSVSMYSSVAP